MFGALGNITSLMKQARAMGPKIEALQTELQQRRIVGSATSNLVQIEMTGVQQVVGCKIDDRLLAQNDRRQLELLIMDAVNDATIKSKQSYAEAMKSLTGGMEIPGLDAALSKLAGG